MIETKVEIPGIAAEALFFRPDDVAEFPAVVFLTDIWGIRPANIGVARRLAERGFAVLMPNVFHRYSRIAPNGFEHGSAEEKTRALHALFAALTPEQMASDGKAYVEFLLAQKGVKPGKAGIVGYCFTGQMAVRAAAAVPDEIAAAASFHGGFLVTDKPDSPHLAARKARAELYFGCAETDRWAPMELVENLKASLAADKIDAEVEIYPGVEHGFAFPQRPAYDKDAAERHWERLSALYRRRLG